MVSPPSNPAHRSISLFTSTKSVIPLISLSLLCPYANLCALNICYLHRVPFLRRTPPIFYHYHSLLELKKHRLCPVLSCLLSIYLDLTECTIYIHSRRYPESCPSESLSSPSPSLGPYLTTTQTLTFENLNLIQRILELTPPNCTSGCTTHHSTRRPPIH